MTTHSYFKQNTSLIEIATKIKKEKEIRIVAIRAHFDHFEFLVLQFFLPSTTKRKKKLAFFYARLSSIKSYLFNEKAVNYMGNM